jgi:hypothetical protein
MLSKLGGFWKMHITPCGRAYTDTGRQVFVSLCVLAFCEFMITFNLQHCSKELNALTRGIPRVMHGVRGLGGGRDQSSGRAVS